MRCEGCALILGSKSACFASDVQARVSYSVIVFQLSVFGMPKNKKKRTERSHNGFYSKQVAAWCLHRCMFIFGGESLTVTAVYIRGS